MTVYYKKYRMKTFLFMLLFLPALVSAQNDVLLLQKHGENIKTYVSGDPIILQTVYDQWFDGTITNLGHDSVYVNGIAFHINEIKTIRRRRTKLNYRTDGNLLMIAGVAWLALGTINGLYRGDPASEWYSTAGLIVGGALILGGFLLRQAAVATYPLGKKYGLHYLDLSSYKHQNNKGAQSTIHQP
jgi:hypothetical protein